MNKVKICGRFDTQAYQRNLAAAQWAANSNFIELEVCEMFEFQWTQYCMQERDNCPALWDKNIDCVITLNGEHDEDLQQFYHFCEEKFQYEESDETDYNEAAIAAVKSYKQASENKFCFIRLGIQDRELDPIELELYSNKVPKTCDNFIKLCKGVESTDGSYGYKNSLIHRIVPNGWIQGGDIIDGSKGDGGKSAMSDGAAFPDESFAVKHDSRGIISMANSGTHTNQSQFFITLEAKCSLDKKFVAFGRVISGSRVLDEIETMDTFNERPKKSLKIIDCGQI